MPQAEALDASSRSWARGVTAVLLIDVSDDEVVRRLGGRRTCAENGHVFHVEFNPPEQRGRLRRRRQRADRPRRRQARGDPPPAREYHEKTEPLVDYYDQQSLLRRIDGAAAPDEVADEIRRTLATLRLERTRRSSAVARRG